MSMIKPEGVVMTEQIKTCLADLYSTYDLETVYTELAKIMTETRQILGKATQRRAFSEQDVVLITYGDSLQAEGEAPLRTLHRFLQTYVQDTLSTVHILPFHPYSSDDGFSVQEFEQIDPALGTWEDIHSIGADYRLMADFVLNHMSAQSRWFKAFLAKQAGYQSLFMTADPTLDLSMVTRPRTSPLLTAFTRPDESTVHVWTTFSADQVDFDYRSPESMLRLMKTFLSYVEHGAEIIRLDAIAYLWKEIGTNCIHLPQTHRFVQLMRAVLDVVAPHVLLITETNVPHAENISYFGDGYNEAQMVYNFTLPPLLAYSMMVGDTQLLRDWINTLKPISPATTFFNFTASHDGIGVRPLEGLLPASEVQRLADYVIAKGGRVSFRQNSDGSASPYELNITYVDAVTDPTASIDQQVDQFMVSQAVMLALAGMPAVYIHSLIGSRNDQDGLARLGYNRAINRAKLDYRTLMNELNDPQSFRRRVFIHYKHLLNIRRQTPYFNPLVPQTALDVGNTQVLAIQRQIDPTHQLLALHNLSNVPQTLSLDKIWSGQAGRDLLKGQTISGPTMTLPAYGVQWVAFGERQA
jgi:sucrose phosphorylase